MNYKKALSLLDVISDCNTVEGEYHACISECIQGLRTIIEGARSANEVDDTLAKEKITVEGANNG